MNRKWVAPLCRVAIVVVAGLGVGATIHLALVDYVDDVDATVTAAINTIDYDFFIPYALGMAAFLLSTGIPVSGPRHCRNGSAGSSA